MYKQKERLIKTEMKEQYDTSMLYSCICDVYCNEGTFEKGSLVKIGDELVETPSGAREEYIRVYDMDDAITQRQSVYGLLDSSDIPVGVTERNFSGVFKEEKELTDELMNEVDVKVDKCNFLRKIHTIGEIMVGLTFIIVGGILVFDVYKFLFAQNFGAKEFLTALWAAIGFGVFDFLLTFIPSRLEKKYDKEYKRDFIRIYKEWKESETQKGA